ncbi:MAG TPA: choice-of-anchor D domain-containing protein, partial [Candidatus Kapabacteria bacterium]|nr:choice-of-anchor D domain-containing protein [Candidatus Kapabacteria bacterium]
GFDLPSEFSITATEDSTLVTITPTTDLRQGFSGNVAYPRGETFTVMLNKGQAVQYMASTAYNMTDFDATGTRITSDKPIAVLAGVQCANIPADKPYCDHICEMLLPIDRWGKAYYSAPFARRVGGDTFLAIASEDNTQVTRVSASGTTTFATLNAGEFYFKHDVAEASYWSSDKPFMLVQYCNGTEFPTQGANSGVADPAMIVLTPIEAYTDLIVFQTPKLKPGEPTFANYANIVVHAEAVSSTTFDGNPISNYSALTLPGVDHVLYRIDQVAPGSHIVRSDSAFGVYTYGFGMYDAYGWPAGGFGSFAVTAEDLAPPSIITQGDDCVSRGIRIVDNGAGSAGHLSLTTSQLDNFAITSITPKGDKREILEYTIEVVDASKVGVARLEVSDDAGNRRLIEHRFDGIAAAKLPEQPVQVVGSKSESTQFAIKVQNTSTEDLTGLEASLSGGVHFSIVSAPGSLEAGATDSVVLAMSTTTSQTYTDTLWFGDACFRDQVVIRGIDAPFQAVELIDDTVNFGSVLVGGKKRLSVGLRNIGNIALRVDSVSLQGSADFSVGDLGAVTVTPEGSRTWNVDLAPSAVGERQATVTLYSEIGAHTVLVKGTGAPSSSVPRVADPSISVHPNPANRSISITSTGEQFEAATVIKVIDERGAVVLERGAIGETSRIDLDVSSLPAGAYVVEIADPDRFRVVKFAIER